MTLALSPAQLASYDQDGFLVLPDFVSPEACDNLRRRAEILVAQFEPKGVVSIFSTHEQTRTSDDYFLEPGGRIRFFFEQDAFDECGRLRQSKELSINKIGHALHDLDPVFDRFSRTADLADLVSSVGFEQPLLLQSMYVFKQPNIGGEVSLHQDSTFYIPSRVRFLASGSLSRMQVRTTVAYGLFAAATGSGSNRDSCGRLTAGQDLKSSIVVLGLKKKSFRSRRRRAR